MNGVEAVVDRLTDLPRRARCSGGGGGSGGGGRGQVFVRAHRVPQPSVPHDGLLVYGYLNYKTPSGVTPNPRTLRRPISGALVWSWEGGGRVARQCV